MIQREYLHEKVQRHILANIKNGLWRQELPSERHLCIDLGVSRRAVRDALEALEKRGIIGTQGRRRRAVLRKPRSRKKKHVTVGALFRSPLANHRPSLVHTIQLIRENLADSGVQVVTYEGAGYYSGKGWQRRLAKLVKENYDCWLIDDASHENQLELLQIGAPCVLIGESYHGTELPYVAIDDRATFRHAFNLLLQRGHRRILFSGVSQNSIAWNELHETVDEIASERSDIRLQHIPNPYKGPQFKRWVREFARHLEPQRGNTAYFAGKPNHYIAFTNAISLSGRCLPEDFSAISRYDDQMLSYLVPEPTRYSLDLDKLARAYARQIRHVLSGRKPITLGIKMIPDLIKGESLGQSVPVTP